MLAWRIIIDKLTTENPMKRGVINSICETSCVLCFEEDESGSLAAGKQRRYGTEDLHVTGCHSATGAVSGRTFLGVWLDNQRQENKEIETSYLGRNSLGNLARKEQNHVLREGGKYGVYSQSYKIPIMRMAYIKKMERM